MPDLLDSLVAFYTLNETSGNAADVTGNGNTLTNTGSTPYISGKLGNGIDFGAGNSSKRLSIGSNLGITGGPVTISAWVRMNTEPTAGQARILFNLGDSVSDTNVYMTYSNITGTFYVTAKRHRSGGTDDGPSVAIAAFGTSAFHHLTITYDGTNVRAYLDGVLIGSPTAATGNGSSPATSQFELGYNSRFASYGESVMDEVGVWSRALSDDEVELLYAEGIGLPYPFSTATTAAVTDIAYTTAVGGGEVEDDSGFTVTERGVCWGVTPLPTVSGDKGSSGAGLGAYTVTMTGLLPATTYYVRAYYVNALGTFYAEEVSFSTLTVDEYTLLKEIDADDGDYIIGRLSVTGSAGTVTVYLGDDGTSIPIAAGAGEAVFQGTFSGLGGLRIVRSADFNGTIDDLFYVIAPNGTTVDWTQNVVAIPTAIASSVLFRRIEEEAFNTFNLYRYLDLLFKDRDGYVTVTLRVERGQTTSVKTKTFAIGNPASGTKSPFEKRRLSILCKDQALIIGLSNAAIGETFSIAKFLLFGDRKPQRGIGPASIISMG